MAKKSTPSASAKKTSVVKESAPVVEVTPVRNSAVPPKSAAIAAATPVPTKKSAPSHDAIAVKAYFMWQSSGGGDFENWISAERQLSSL